MYLRTTCTFWEEVKAFFTIGRTCQLEEFMQRAQETSFKKIQLVVSPPEDPFLRNKYDASPLGTIDTDDVANVLVQMERCRDRFNVDFQYPVSAFVAFGICLTRFCSSSALVGGVPM